MSVCTFTRTSTGAASTLHMAPTFLINVSGVDYDFITVNLRHEMCQQKWVDENFHCGEMWLWILFNFVGKWN